MIPIIETYPNGTALVDVSERYNVVDDNKVHDTLLTIHAAKGYARGYNRCLVGDKCPVRIVPAAESFKQVAAS